jgi:CheY-like chemotaxis protein
MDGNVVPFARRLESSVLVVEDDPSQLEELVEVIRSFGWSASGVSDGYAAVAAIRHGRPKLVMLDIHLPTIDGIRVLEFAHSLGFAGPVVLVSGDPDALRRAIASNTNPISILEKPINPKILGEILYTILSA